MATIYGTTTHDKIILGYSSPGVTGFPTRFVTAGPDTIYAKAGHDFVNGYLGNDRIYGDAGYDTLSGHYGNDRLYGGPGKDTLYGGSGNDILHGGSDPDTMYGGPGADTYYVDGMDDKVVEYVNQGTDRVVSSVSTDIEWLPGNVENLTLTGTAYYGDGNSLNNHIVGSAANNALLGYGGNDRLWGRNGDDELFGGDGWDTLDGGVGNDHLDGHAGADTITGGAGNDRFDFSNTGEGPGADFLGAYIKDFGFAVGNDDSIGLQAHPGAVFNAGLVFTAGGSLNPSWYFEGVGTGNGIND